MKLMVARRVGAALILTNGSSKPRSRFQLIFHETLPLL